MYGSSSTLVVSPQNRSRRAGLRQWVIRVVHSPVFVVVLLTPLILVGAVDATGPQLRTVTTPLHNLAITPVAAVVHDETDSSGPVVLALTNWPDVLHIVDAPTVLAPPPAAVVNTPGGLAIPAIAMSAYRHAEQMMAASDPHCGIGWNLLAGIGRIESLHSNGGATDARGTATPPIYGPALDGTLPGNEIIVQASAGGRVIYARAVGPMQFLPGTWARYASDGSGDGVADPQNLYDSALAAARYLCSGGLNLRDQSQVLAAILRYNNSMVYAQNVLGWAAAYATGVAPVDLPPLTGPPPPIDDRHMENPEGLGPGLPLNVDGLPRTDPLAQISLTGAAPTVTDLPAMPPWPVPAQTPPCPPTCIEQQPEPSQNVADAPPARDIPPVVATPAAARGPLPGPSPVAPLTAPPSDPPAAPQFGIAPQASGA
jgi:hypothetical protein